MAEPTRTSPGAARGGYRTGEETRQKLVDAALLLFSRQGYELSGTREICAVAGVAVPAIAYHFGGKEGLYLACADHVVARYRDRMRPALGAMSRALPAMSPDEARAALQEVVRMLVGMVRDASGDTGEGEPWLSFMVREMARPGPAHDRLYRDLWSPGLGIVARLIAACRGRGAPGEAESLDSLLLLSSLSALTSARRLALDFTGWPSIDRAAAEAIEARLRLWVNQL